MKVQKSLTEAQALCLKMINKILPDLGKMYEKAERNLLLEDVEISIDPYNNGYRVRADFRFNYPNMHRKNTDVRDALYRMKDFYLQPESFFVDKLSNNEATFEGKRLSLKTDYDSFRSSKTGNISEAENELKVLFMHPILNEIEAVSDMLDRL